VPFLKYGSRSNALKAGAPRGSSVWASIVIAPQLMSDCDWGRQRWEIADSGSAFCFSRATRKSLWQLSYRIADEGLIVLERVA
jgi:hypothetical protein